jgi:hypothetical protein
MPVLMEKCGSGYILKAEPIRFPDESEVRQVKKAVQDDP